MGKIRRGGFVFVTWIGDHSPRHVHVFHDGRLLLKYDLDGDLVLQGRMTRRLRNLLDALRREGKL